MAKREFICPLRTMHEDLEPWIHGIVINKKYTKKAQREIAIPIIFMAFKTTVESCYCREMCMRRSKQYLDLLNSEKLFIDYALYSPLLDLQRKRSAMHWNKIPRSLEEEEAKKELDALQEEIKRANDNPLGSLDVLVKSVTWY